MLQAYQFATEEPGVIVLDMPVYKPLEQGLPADAKCLVLMMVNYRSLCKSSSALLAIEGIDEVRH